MKKVLSIGKTLNKVEQKEVNGGFGSPAPYGICLSSGCFVRCDQKCADGDDPIC